MRDGRGLQGKRQGGLSRWSTVLAGGLLGGGLMLACAGCLPAPQDVLVDADGNQIRRVQIDRIVFDSTLTDSEKRDQLRDLGITDEALIEILLQ